MGGSSSRELEAAQSQVRRLTGELQKANAFMKTQQSGGGLAVAAREAQAKLQKELQSKAQQLEATESELSVLRAKTADLPKFKNEVANAREELVHARKEAAGKGVLVTELQEQLTQSKQELEELFGKLKFAETEKGHHRGSQNEEKRLLAVQQREAAEASARLVAEANAAVSGALEGVHPVFGDLIADFGHKRLYRGSPTTLWAGTTLWERQRAFRQARANLIATAKTKSKSNGWPGAVVVVETSESSDAGDGGTDGSAPLGMLIDGQHRLGAAHLLSQRGKLDGALSTMLVEVYPPMEDQAVKDLFTEINCAEPYAAWGPNRRLTGSPSNRCPPSRCRVLLVVLSYRCTPLHTTGSCWSTCQTAARVIRTTRS